MKNNFERIFVVVMVLMTFAASILVIAIATGIWKINLALFFFIFIIKSFLIKSLH